MTQDEIFHLPCTDPQFLTRIFLHVLDLQKEHPFVQLFNLRREVSLSFLFDLSAIQESFRFRALNRARCLAMALIDEKGEVKKDTLKSILTLYEEDLFYPDGSNDSILHEHALRFLRALESREILQSLKRFQRPLCHQWAEELVRQTLGIPFSQPLTDGLIRSAVLCACLTPLRQSVGSCFATAPAILIQRDQVAIFLDDLYQLLSTGKLKRTFAGVEYAIPLSPSTGIGDLKKNLIAQDSKAKVEWSPGLVAALEAAGVLSSRQTPESQVLELIQTYGAGKNHLSVEDFFQHVLFDKYELKGEDLEKGQDWELAQFKSSKMGFGGPDPSLTRKLDRIGKFKQKEKEVRAAFKGICDNALLKSWEFTLASFSEVKMEFSRWNLYLSLGLSADEPGGIGGLIYRTIDEKVKAINKKIEEHQKQYEIAFDQVRATETLLRNAGSEAEARRLQAEFQSRSYQMRITLEMRDAVYSQGSHYANLFSFLQKQYDRIIPDYFQEIYDAEMQDYQGNIFDDSPAGFRLVYKHGRPDPSLWTLIYTADQYIDSLVKFFSASESHIVSACEWEGGSDVILEITSLILQHIRTKEFLDSALQRMKKVQAEGKKPWAYISGGTMTTLLKTYYCRESEFFVEEKWVENESELLIFILDVLKNLPPRIADPFLKNPSKGILMTSPSHAFVLLPGQEGLHQGWQEEIFTYTWVRDNVFLPSQHFYSEMRLNAIEQTFLLSKFCEQLPAFLGHHLNQIFSPQEKKMTIVDLRNRILDALFRHAKVDQPRQRQTLKDGLDAFLYQALPIVPSSQWKMLVRRILSDLMSEKVEETLQLFSDVPATFMTAREIKECAQGCFLLAEQKAFHSFDLHNYVASHARFVGLAPPSPLLFADTNWTNNFFGFVVNPGTGHFELWRLDKTLSQGVPMSEWKHWLNGSDRKTWSIFPRPYEYEKGR